MYKSELINNFYQELFSTEYHDTASALENMKTDLFFELNLDDSYESFEKWLNGLVEGYAADYNVDKTTLLKAIAACSEFKKDAKEEFDQVYEDYDVYDDDYYSDDEE